MLGAVLSQVQHVDIGGVLAQQDAPARHQPPALSDHSLRVALPDAALGRGGSQVQRVHGHGAVREAEHNVVVGEEARGGRCQVLAMRDQSLLGLEDRIHWLVYYARQFGDTALYKLIGSMSTLYYTEEQNPHLAQLRILSSLLNNRLSTSKIASRFAPIIYHEGSLVLNEPNAIALHLAHNSKLAGPTFDEQVQVYSWLEYFNNELLPLVAQIYGQADLKIPLSQPKFAYALEELKKVLKVLDDRLKMRTFLVGDSLTLADISLCCSLERAFVLVIAPELRKKHTSLTRWFNYVRNVPAFVDHLGEVKLCEQAYEPDYTMNALKQQKTPQNEAVKVQTAGSEEIPKKQETGVLNFLVEFKKSFQKAEDKAKVLDDLLSHFPAEFSLWRVYYSKDVVEGKDENATVQKAKEMVDSLQTVNSQTFGTLGVYLAEETKQYEIRGVMMWRGAEVSQAWKEHKDHQYYIFHKLEAAPDAEVVRQYWLDQPKAEGLSLRKSFQLA